MLRAARADVLAPPCDVVHPLGLPRAASWCRDRLGETTCRSPSPGAAPWRSCSSAPHGAPASELRPPW